jgi:competence protein ComEC
MRAWAIAVIGVLAGVGAQAAAAEAQLRVVDVGNGLCVVGHTPDGHSFLYDAGDTGSQCLAAVKSLIPEPKIDVIVLSHSDADHIGELPAILDAKAVGVIVYPEDYHLELTQAMKGQIRAIDNEGGAIVWSLKHKPLSGVTAAERSFAIGANGRLTIIAGWYDREDARAKSEDEYPKPEHNNAVSVVARFEYRGHSVLLTGDTVGRLHTSKSAVGCHYAEREMVENKAAWPIDSDVLVGQHHGSNNASTTCFIKAVSPEFVVFSAGHKNYQHPNAKVAARFLAAGVPPKNMFRTDRGDDEGQDEWIYLSIKGCVDKPGDDDVDIWLPDNGRIRAEYRLDKKAC